MALDGEFLASSSECSSSLWLCSLLNFDCIFFIKIKASSCDVSISEEYKVGCIFSLLLDRCCCDAHSEALNIDTG